MKKYIFLFFLASLLMACPPLPRHAYEKIEYKAVTRGSSESIIVTVDGKKSNLTHLKNSSENITRVLKNKESIELFDILRYMHIDKIDQLEVPSKKHQYDAALVTTIEITTKSGVYRSVTFDHDNPPVELKELVDYLQKLVNKKAEN